VRGLEPVCRALIAVSLVTGAGVALDASAQPRSSDGGRDRAPVHGAQPNPGEVRPGSPHGDADSATAGQIVPEPDRRVLGLTLPAVFVIGAVILVLLALPAVVLRSRRPARRM
jgi:hypothetical protein